MTWFQSLNPLLVFALTPPLLAWWSRLALRGREPAPLRKMALGAGGVAASYLMLALVTIFGAGPASWLWLVAFFVVLTAGELFVLPVGLGLFARLAPAGMAATTIAAWFLAAFAGNLLAGALGTLWSRLSASTFFRPDGGRGGLVFARALDALHAPAPRAGLTILLLGLLFPNWDTFPRKRPDGAV